MKKIEKLKLKKGDNIWVKIPINAVIVRINKKLGYTIETKDGIEYMYFGDDEVELIKSVKKL